MSKKKKEGDVSLLLYGQGIDRASQRRLHRQKMMQDLVARFIEGTGKNKKNIKSFYSELDEDSDSNITEKPKRTSYGDRGELGSEIKSNEELATEVVGRFCSEPSFGSALQAAFAKARLALAISAIDHHHVDAVREAALAASIVLPEQAPRLWKDRDKSSRHNPAQFIREVYAAWLCPGGIARHQVGELDPELGKAYSQWTRPGRHPEDVIEFEPGNPFGRIEDPHAAIERRRALDRASKARARERKQTDTSDHLVDLAPASARATAPASAYRTDAQASQARRRAKTEPSPNLK